MHGGLWTIDTDTAGAGLGENVPAPLPRRPGVDAMTGYLLGCYFCGAQIDQRDDYYRHVEGWERPGRGINDRSGSSLVLREHVKGEVACTTCITKLRNGVSVGQEQLL